jgi:hypothetical protein
MFRRIGAAAVAALAFGAPGIAAAGDETVTEEVLRILNERGIIEEGDYARLVSKNRAYEEEHANRLPTLEFFGDFRGRYEYFSYDDDKFDNDRPDRSRLRYRLRFGAGAEINDYISVKFRLATGSEQDSRNQTLGGGRDFIPDSFNVDWAYVDLRPFRGVEAPVSGGYAVVRFGKMPNPFRWKIGTEWIWDADISPEGVAIEFGATPGEALRLWGNVGYFIGEENSTSRDPHLLAVQGGGDLAVNELLDVGGRLSWYSFHSIDADFLARNFAEGNVFDGLDGSTDGTGFDVGEMAAYLRWKGVEGWPVLVYATYARNFDAESSTLFPGVGEEDQAYSIGAEIGDKKKWLKLGLGFFHVEANAFPARLTDSDIVDSRNNREGWALYGSRAILKNTDFNFSLYFGSDSIDDDLPGLASSVANAERVRLRTDLVVKF